nr:MAG TPA: hypothetical protein [Caudoviricetes sp.]
MYYVIGKYVYAPYDGHDFDERATDTIDDLVWELYSQDKDYYKIENGKFIALKQQEELKADVLRKRREKECFPIINRGALWYEKLTEEQKTELSAWYEAWLDAPETGTAPTAPVWLNEVAGQAKTI